MDEGSPFKASARQILWIAAGVAGLTAVVLAGSWLFSPRSTGGAPAAPSGKLQEEQVQKQTFQPEAPQAPHTEPQAAPGEASAPAQTPPQPAAPAPSPEAVPPAQPKAEEAPAPAAQAPPPAAEPIKPPVRAGGQFAIQVGAFERQANAKDIQHKLEVKGFSATIVQKGGKYKVLVPGFADRASAEKALAAMRREGFSTSFVVPQEQP